MAKESKPAGMADMQEMMKQFKGSAAMSEQLAQAALKAAEKSNEVSNKWTKQTLANVGSVAKVQEDPADFSKALGEFASSQGSLATEQMTAFAEIAKTLQEQTIEIMMKAGGQFGEDAASAVQQATDMMNAAAKPK